MTIATRKRTFEEWKKVVDAYIAQELGGMTSDDLPDYAYMRAYQDGVDPIRCARRAMKAAQSF